MSDIVYVDTETTGLDPDLHRIWDVAVQTYEPDGSFEVIEFTIRLTQREIQQADPRALEIGHFHERYSEEDASGEFGVLLTLQALTQGKYLAGNVVSFDEERLRRRMWHYGLVPGWHYHLIDVEAVAAGALSLEPPWNSEAISAALGVDLPAENLRHTAAGDADWARRIYEAAMEYPETRALAEAIR